MFDVGAAEVPLVKGRAMRPVDGFGVWVEPYIPSMARLAARMVGPADRDDVVQESLTRAWRRWETYRPERGSPEVWLLAIVADRARRLGRRRTSRHLDLMTPGLVHEHDLDLERAVRVLPRRQRLAVELHYFVGLTTAETAAVMGCAEGTVKSCLFDARAGLRRTLEHP